MSGRYDPYEALDSHLEMEYEDRFRIVDEEINDYWDEDPEDLEEDQ